MNTPISTHTPSRYEVFEILKTNLFSYVVARIPSFAQIAPNLTNEAIMLALSMKIKPAIAKNCSISDLEAECRPQIREMLGDDYITLTNEEKIKIYRYLKAMAECM